MLWKVIFHIIVVFVAFSQWCRGSSSWWLFRLWWYRELSQRRFVVPLVAARLSSWWSSVFSARLTWYLHCDTSLKYLSLWHITEMYMMCCKIVLLCSDNFSTIFYRIIFFSHWKQGVVVLTALRRWWHRELSVRQFKVLPVTVGFISLMTLVFSAGLTWYLH